MSRSAQLSHPIFEALRHSIGICSCLAIRQTSRAVTQMYDQALEPAGLSIGQYSLLAALYYSDSMPVKKLAPRLHLERTSLTRAVEPLERDGLLMAASDPYDRRTKLISLNSKGLERLVAAYPLWETAQKRISEGFDAAELKQFRSLLSQACDVASSSVGD